MPALPREGADDRLRRPFPEERMADPRYPIGRHEPVSTLTPVQRAACIEQIGLTAERCLRDGPG